MAKDFLQRPFDDVPPPQNKPLWNVLEDDNIDPESLVKLINRAVANEVSDAEAIMQALLDGPLDVDKMAYLRYDSQATSMPYGAGVDSEGLFTSLMVLLPYDYPELNHAEVGLSSRGISAAESIITARYHMYGRVYWHRTNRAIMAMLSYAFRHLMDNKVSFITFRQYIQETFRLSDWEAVRWLSSQFSQAVEAGVIKCESNRPLKNLLPGIADGTRRLHKQLVAFSGHRAAGKLADCHEALVGFDQRQIETIRVGVMDLIGHYADDVTDDEVLIDVPHSKRKEELYVRVVDEQTGELHSFSDYSQIAQAVKEQYDSLACPSRIFVSPRLAETMRSEVPKVRQEIAKLIERR
jgi:HD superfamily phosphohydrolase